MPILKNAADVKVEAVIISVDRMEKGKSDKSAVQEVMDDFGIRVCPIVTVNDIIDCIEDGTIGGKEYLDAMKEYRKTYGVEA